MTRVLLGLLLAASAGSAYADRMPDVEDTAPVDPDRGNFWRDLTEPHKVEIDDILAKARDAMTRGQATYVADYDPTGAGRQKLFRELFGMLRYARRLAPDHAEVLRLYAEAADTIGKTREAMDALHAIIDVVGADKASPGVTGHLGAIYLRLGQLDDAVRYLRMAQGPIVAGSPDTALVLVNLSTALAMRGQSTDAIDVLADALPAAPAYYSNEYQLVTFALAVAYDRDDQRTAAVVELDHLRANLQEQWGLLVGTVLATVRFAPAEDQQYYRALLLEATDNYADARAEWALYAAGHGAYAQRALEHVAAIDKRPKTAAPIVAPTTILPYPPPIIPKRRHRHP